MFVKTQWYSERMKRSSTLVRWGHFGQPVLLFPTAGGDAEECERFLMIKALEPLLSAGRIKLYSPDSVAGQVWFDKGPTPRPPHVDAAPVPRVDSPRGGAGHLHRLQDHGHPHLDGGRVHRGLPRRRRGVPLARRVSPRPQHERHVQPHALHRGRHAHRGLPLGVAAVRRAEAPGRPPRPASPPASCRL
jgi:hypothetical protein